MNAASIYTKRLWGLDKNVWLTLLIMVIISIGLLGYSLVGKEAFIPVNLSIKSFENRPDGIFFKNEVLRFSATSPRAKNIVWDFGDNSAEGEGFNVTHTYQKDGKYLVTVAVNGKDKTDTTIMVRIAPTPVNLPKGLRQIIMAPEMAYVDQAVTFNTDSFANGYEWRVLNRNNFAIKREKGAIYSFPNEGEYTIVLKLNNSNIEFKKGIYITEDPKKPLLQIKPGPLLPPARPEKLLPDNPANTNPLNNKNQQVNPVYPSPSREEPTVKKDPVPVPIPVPNTNTTTKPKRIEISPENLKDELQDLLNGNARESDFYGYLCDDGSALVRVNKESPILFTKFCEKYSGQKNKYDLESSEIILHDNGCEKNIVIKLKKKGIIDRIF